MTDRIAQLQKILAAEPNDTFCLYGLALEYAKRDEHDKAIEYFNRTLAVDPNYCYAYFHKAKSQESLDDAVAATATLQQGLARARAANDAKAAAELQSFLDELRH